MGYGKFKGLNEDLSDAGRERRLAAGKIVAYYNSYIDKHGEEGKALARDFLKKLGKAVDMSDQIHENTDIEEEKSWIAIACNKYQGDKMGLAEDHKHRDSFFNLWYT